MNTLVINTPLLSISIVVYKPNFDLLDATLFHLKLSLEYLFENKKTENAIENKRENINENNSENKNEKIIANKNETKNENIIIYIIDNNPEDSDKSQIISLLDKYYPHSNSHSQFPNIKTKLITNPGNPGYGHGNNKVMLTTPATFHLVLNPDVLLEKESLLHAIQFMENHPDVGLLSPSVYGVDGERHYLCKKNPSLFILFLRRFAPGILTQIFQKHLDSFEMKDKDYNNIIWNVPYLTGCFMLFNSRIIKTIQGFDTKFFLYLEDADITRRILMSGYKTAYVPSIKICHKWSRGPHHNFKLMLVSIHSSFIYWWKWSVVYYAKKISG